MNQSRPDIYLYYDHSKFLEDHIKYLKSAHIGFNIFHLSKVSEISVGYLSMVFAGKRKLTEKALHKILPHLQLNQAEQSLLYLLCRMNLAKSQDEKLRVLDQIQKLRGYQSSNSKESAVYQYLTKWYYVAIRELAELPEFKLDPKWIQSRLGKSLPLADINRATTFLIKNEFLKVSSAGKVSLPERKLECVDEVYRAAFAQFHRQIFGLAMETLPALGPQHKTLQGITTAVSEEGFLKVKALLEDTLKKISKIAAEDKKKDELFQISLLGFPLTRVGETKT